MGTGTDFTHRARKGLQRLVKKVSPTTPIPEIDTVDRVTASVLKPLATKIETLERQILERDVKDRLERQVAGIKAKYGLTEDEITAGVVPLMTDKDNPIPTYDAAARVYLASRRSATPTPASYSPPVYSMPEKEIWAPGIGNNARLDQIGMKAAYEAWNDLRTGKVAGLGAARGAAM